MQNYRFSLNIRFLPNTVRLIVFLAVFLNTTPKLSAFVDRMIDPTPPRIKQIESVQVGVEGFYKNGLWTPILVQWSCDPLIESVRRVNASVEFMVKSVDSDGTPIKYRFNSAGAKIVSTTTEQTICQSVFYVKLGRKDATLSISAQDQQGTVLGQSLRPTGNPAKQGKPASDSLKSNRFFEPIPSERPIYLIVGNEDIGLQGAIAELSLREDRRPLLVKVSSVADLPDQWFGYEAVDMIVLTTTEPELFEGMTSESPKIKAIDDWIKLGGRLFFCAGKDAGSFLEQENGALRPFLPGKFDTMTELRLNAPLEKFVDSKRQIFMNGTDEAPFLKMPYFTEPKGIVFLKETDLTLISRCAHGFGTIVYFGGDLSDRPLSVWRDRILLVKKIMQWDKEKQVAGRGNVSLIQLGYNDISGQVRSALDRFDNVRVIPFSLILILLMLYWLAVGPLDWFLVHKILKKPVWTWITFPVWILIFCGLAYYLAAPGRPTKSMCNELTLVDIDGETKTLRCSSWGNVYSSGDERFDLVLTAPEKFQIKYQRFLPTLFSWNGLPGSGLGGMAPKTVSPTVWQDGSTQTFFQQANNPGPGIEQVPIQVRSTKSFFGQSWALDEETNWFKEYAFAADLADEEGVLTGKLEAPQKIMALENCILVYGRWVQELGTILPGQKIDIDNRRTPRRELRDLLIPDEMLKDDQLKRIATYNTQSTDLDYIARILSLYGAVGGFEAVGLSNAFQRSLDLSDLFSVDRAVLIGTAGQAKSFEFDPGFGSNIVGANLQGKRHVVFRQSIPIRLTELSPRIGGGKKYLMQDDLAPEIRLIEGKGGYSDPMKKDNKKN